MILPLILILLFSSSSAIPSTNFQLSSQIPPLAVSSAPYSFQFAATTFTSSDHTDLRYSLQDAPDWLRVDSESRTITGSAPSDDVGSVAFAVVATDATGSASMQLTLMVVSNNQVQPPISIKDQLDKFGILTSDDSLAFRTTEPFAITFEPDTFQSASSITYFATSRDRTPLPSWVHFDPASLTFSGASPPLIDIPQTFGVSLIASIVPGFANSVVSFDLIINDHQLAFVPFEVTSPLNNEVLDLKPIFRNNLILDEEPIPDAMLTGTRVQLPPGLTYDPSTMLVSKQSSTVPSSQEIRLFATDAYGDTAQALVHVETGSTLFRSQLGTLKAVIGRPFSYQLPGALLSDAVTAVSIDLGSASDWLEYEASSETIRGKIPTSISPTVIVATITASSATATATERFGIRIVRSAKRSAPPPTPSISILSPHFPHSTAHPEDPLSEAHKLAGLSAGKIAGIVIVVVIAVAILLAALFIYCLRRRKRGRDTGLKSRIVVQKLPDDSVDDLSEYGATPSDQRKDFIEPLPLIEGTRDGMKRQDRSARQPRYQCGDSVLQPSQRPIPTTTDGSPARAWNRDTDGRCDQGWVSHDSITNGIPTAAPAARYSHGSGFSDGLQADRVAVGLGHGRPSIHSPPPGLAGDPRGPLRERPNRLSTGRASSSSRQLFSFGPEQRQRQRLGGIPPPSIRLVEPQDQGDFNEKYHNYIRKRASSKRKSNPLFAGYSARLSSHQALFMKHPSSLRLRKRKHNRESQASSVGGNRSSNLLEHVRTGSSPDRSERSNDWEDVTETDLSGSNYDGQARDGQGIGYGEESEPESEVKEGRYLRPQSISEASFDIEPADVGTTEEDVATAPDSTRSTGKAFL